MNCSIATKNAKKFKFEKERTKIQQWLWIKQINQWTQCEKLFLSKVFAMHQMCTQQALVLLTCVWSDRVSFLYFKSAGSNRRSEHTCISWLHLNASHTCTVRMCAALRVFTHTSSCALCLASTLVVCRFPYLYFTFVFMCLHIHTNIQRIRGMCHTLRIIDVHRNIFYKQQQRDNTKISWYVISFW